MSDGADFQTCNNGETQGLAALATGVPTNSGTKVYFNPFAFSIEQNNEFLRLGYEPMPIGIPNV